MPLKLMLGLDLFLVAVGLAALSQKYVLLEASLSELRRCDRLLWVRVRNAMVVDAGFLSSMRFFAVLGSEGPMKQVMEEEGGIDNPVLVRVCIPYRRFQKAKFLVNVVFVLLLLVNLPVILVLAVVWS